MAESLPNLTVQQLEYLDAAVREPTWARAAQTLGVSPSALSQGLAELERRLGLTLFRPEGRRRVPTEQAGPVIEHARRVLAQTRDLSRWAADARRGRTGRLRVGLIDTAAISRYPEVLRAFRRDEPQVDLHLVVAPSATLLDQLRDDRLDLAVCVAPDEPIPDVSLTALADEPLRVYAPPGAPASAPARWGPWVLFPRDSHTRRVIERALVAEGATVEVIAESHQPEVLEEMVRLGLGWTVLPVDQVRRSAEPLRQAQRRALCRRPLAIARRSSALANPAAARLIDALVAAERLARRRSVD